MSSFGETDERHDRRLAMIGISKSLILTHTDADERTGRLVVGGKSFQVMAPNTIAPRVYQLPWTMAFTGTVICGNSGSLVAMKINPFTSPAFNFSGITPISI